MTHAHPHHEAPPPLAGAALWTAGALLAVANFMVVLDTTIANVSVPNIAGGLAVSPSQGTWVITSYAVAEAITVPLSGWLSQRFGAVKVFVFATFGFGVCSALCGIAPSLGVLVMFRVLQGLSGGPLIPLSQTLLRRIFPPKQQAQAMGLWAMTTVVGPIAGPLLGGALVDWAGWPWVFFINVPIAVVVGFFSWRMLAKHETDIHRVPIDYVGLGLLIVWVGAMQIMLDKGKDLDWFQSKFIIALAIIAAVGAVSFVIWELTSAHPVVNLKVFRHRGFATAAIIMSLTFAAFFSSVVLVPLWLQVNLGYTATWAGRVTALQGVLALIMSPIVARLSEKVDGRILVSVGVMVLAGVSCWRSTFASNIDAFHIALPQLAQGFAVPFFFIPTLNLALGAVTPAEIPSAAGLINFMRTTAGAFGTSITTTAWEDLGSVHRADLVGNLNAAPQTVTALSNAGFSASQATGQLDNLVQTQAVMAATDQVFLLTALVMVVSACCIWIAPKPRLSGQAPAGAH
jgi:DHA2 family multidrug resistance protein